MLRLAGSIIYWVASLYLLVLIFRMILDWAHFFAPQWRPKGFVVVVANVIYRLTDPPIRALRHRIPPLRLGGGIALDVGFMVVFFGVVLVQWVGSFLIRLSVGLG
ncbi:YggT family protein [Schaalia sp. ZJ405]|nr:MULTISPECIES: YggT family protein [unclassified Schaalia]QPK82193.1 YggT family protein [Schaalia sp. ZJ405]